MAGRTKQGRAPAEKVDVVKLNSQLKVLSKLMDKTIDLACDQKPDVDIIGADCCNSPFFDFSVEDCCKACTKDNHCLGWTYQNQVRSCWLKYSTASTEDKANVTSGFMTGATAESRKNASKNWDIDKLELQADKRWHGHIIGFDSHGKAQYMRRQKPDPRAGPIFFVIMFTIIIFQFLLHMWKTHRPRSFELATLACMWIFPFALGAYMHLWRFVVAWLTFSICTFRIIFKASRKPMQLSTPKQVYRYFNKLFQVCYTLAVIGYVILLVELMTSIFALLGLYKVTEYGLLSLAYGLYFGVLGRDVASLASESMAQSIGYYGRGKKQDGKIYNVPPNLCVLCGCELQPLLEATNNGKASLIKLSCEHSFHEQCIRGWSMVGKKDSCPICSEKVDLKSLARSSPWEKASRIWANLLDAIRYLVAWNPIILLSVKLALMAIGLDGLTSTTTTTVSSSLSTPAP